MAQIFPFCGLRYNNKKIKNIDKVFAPPYDIISADEQKKLYAQHPFNVIRLILGKTSSRDNANNNRYTRAERVFNKWIKDDVLIQDKEPSIYIYTQDYTFEGKQKKRIGFIARMKLGEKEEVCLPHEQTLMKPKVDRLALIRAVRANLSPIFTFYIDKKNEIENLFKPFLSEQPLISYQGEDKIKHSFWQVHDKRIIKKVCKIMRRKQTFIADGHHRYEVSKTFYKEMSKKKGEKGEFNYVMMYFTGFNEQNLSVMPTHRLVKTVQDLGKRMELLHKYFKIMEVNKLGEMLALQSKTNSFSLGMYYKNKFYVLKMKDSVLLSRLMRKSPAQWRKLDVAMLNKVIFEHIFKLNAEEKEENIQYTRDPVFAVESIRKKKFSIAFFPNATKAEQVKKIALSRNRMPQKSTYFYPKPVTGLVINKF